MTELQNSLDHKENSISQLKSQLEYQCLGELIVLVDGLRWVVFPLQSTSQTTPVCSVPPERRETPASEDSAARPERRECEAGKDPAEVAEKRETADFPGWRGGTAEMETRRSRAGRERRGRKVRLAATASQASQGREGSLVCRAMWAGRERRETRGCLGVTGSVE